MWRYDGQTGSSEFSAVWAYTPFVRTETAIAVRLKRIGASTEDPDHYTARGLAALFGVDTKVVTGWIEKGWLIAQRRGTARTDQQGGDQWWIHRDQVRRFVTESVAVIDVRKLDKVWFVELLAGSAPASSASCAWASVGAEDGALVLHPERRQAVVGAAVIALTGLEYSVLELLLTREDKVVTREAFMRHIYGEGDRPEIKILDVVICGLRRKLARAGWGGTIETDWGLGYTLVRVPTPVAAIGV
jgi:hypothetical protein